MNTSGGYHEYIGGVQYIGGYHEYIGGCSVDRGDIMSTSGDIMSTSGDIMMNVGEQVSKNLSISIENPDVLNIPHVLNIPRYTHDISPMYSWYPPMY